jgi:hypothetical protein
MPAGRPTKYNANFHPKLVEAWARAGLTEEEIAEKLELSGATIKTWKNKYPEFMAAVTRGRAPIDDEIEAALYKSAHGHVHTTKRLVGDAVVEIEQYYPPDPRSLQFFLKNRRPKKWREKQEIAHTGLEPLRYDLSKMTPEQREAALILYNSAIPDDHDEPEDND